MICRFLIRALIVAWVSGCGPSRPPGGHAGTKAQPARAAQQGVILCVRKVNAVAGPLAVWRASSAGSAARPAATGGAAFEYIVRRPGGDLVSVTQQDTAPLVVGQRVLVVAGNQARVVRN